MRQPRMISPFSSAKSPRSAKRCWGTQALHRASSPAGHHGSDLRARWGIIVDATRTWPPSTSGPLHGGALAAKIPSDQRTRSLGGPGMRDAELRHGDVVVVK